MREILTVKKWCVVMVTVIFIGLLSNVNCERPPPDYTQTLSASYSLTVELTVLQQKTTTYAEEVHERRLYHDELSNTQGVRIQQNGSSTTNHYFPLTNEFVIEDYYHCMGTTPGENFWGWLDEVPEHGEKNYGPSSILRLANILNPVYSGSDISVEGVICEMWTLDLDDDVTIEYYYSQVESWISPDVNWFPDGGGQMPMEMKVKFKDGLENLYSVVLFLPYVHKHSILEPARGKDCEALVGVQMNAKVPSIPWHFSFAEEVVIGPEIDGYSMGTQHVDKLQLTYAGKMSLTSLLLTPPLGPGQEKSFAWKAIHDFNTGVQYLISTEYGNCSMNYIPANGFDTHYGGFLGTGGSLLGPNEMFHLDNTYAFAGERISRGLLGDFWTSTRKDDIPDPWANGMQLLPKAVMEYYFSQGWEKTPSGKLLPTNLPFRGNLYLYNSSDDSQITGMMTTNFYDFRVINMFTEDEFSVESCYERRDDYWFYLDVYFPADHEDQMNAASNRQKKFKEEFMLKLIEIGEISPVRMASVEVTIGIPGRLPNTTDVNTIIVRVKLLDRAPYIFSYKQPTDEPLETPGNKEIRLEHIFSPNECAEICSLDEKANCQSFHYCHQYNLCFMSQKDSADGEPVSEETGDCDHFVNSITNETFPDYPTAIVYNSVLDAIIHGQFVFGLNYQNKTVGYEASGALLHRNPDPEDYVRNQFTLESRTKTLTNPDSEFKVTDLYQCLSRCVNWNEFRCETAVHMSEESLCRLSAKHFHDINETEIATHSRSYVHARSYMSDYSPVLGGVSLNSSGPIYEMDRIEECARRCSEDKTIDCQSFEWCFDEFLCHLHTEHFLDVVDGGDYTTDTHCIHFSSKTDQIFTRYPNQGLPSSKHHIVAKHTSVEACAKYCEEATDKTCQSFDYCNECVEEDTDICGDTGPASLCFLAEHHMGEKGFKLLPAKTCDHYERDMFGDKDYASWIASQRKSDKPYTSGDMTGLAFGMLFLGIILVLGTLFALTKYKPASVPKDLSIGLSNMPSSGETEI